MSSKKTKQNKKLTELNVKTLQAIKEHKLTVGSQKMSTDSIRNNWEY